MTIDKELNQAIIYHKKMASIYKRNHNDSDGNAELKLSEWLEELKRLRARKTGKWLCSDDLYETAVCSCCGWDTTEPWQHIKSWFEFCPHCGADMREDQDGKGKKSN